MHPVLLQLDMLWWVDIPFSEEKGKEDGGIGGGVGRGRDLEEKL